MLLLSRLAENLYWTGRYMERAENTARLLNVNYYATLENAGRAREYWKPLLELMGGDAPLRAKYGRVDARSISQWMAFDLDNPSSIASSMRYARENARGLRDRIPSEMWESVNRSYLQLCFENESVLDRDGLFEYCAHARDSAQFFFGIAFATLPRDEGWSFMRAGQMLERGDNTLRVLRGRFRGLDADISDHPTARALQEQRWVSALKGLSAYEAYRKQVHSGIDPDLIGDFLLLDEFFPRSVRYSAVNLKDALKQIEQWHPGQHPDILRLARWLVARLQYLTVDDILKVEDPSLEVLIGDFNRIGAAIHNAYFEQE
ncbi:alpha-E domain-containing protein [Deinococcus sp.]|uniref:alpha-E domain-containing protein n=1 Tax=Deinococcus sp. TaxID=47478 RepID=UPI0025B8708A|nr:alpha-E domain-containing protein [Deinococcus sp.]